MNARKTTRSKPAAPPSKPKRGRPAKGLVPAIFKVRPEHNQTLRRVANEHDGAAEGLVAHGDKSKLLRGILDVWVRRGAKYEDEQA